MAAVRRLVLLSVAIVVAARTAAAYADCCDRESIRCARGREGARSAAAQVEFQWPVVASGPSAAYLRRLGARLGESTDRGPRGWTFVLIRHATANAFSVGNGRVYVTEGAITLARSEAEFAAILAHEMGHDIAGHFCPQRAATGRFQEVRVGAVVQRIDPLMEREADRLSLGILSAAGYDARAALTIATRVSKEEALSRVHLWDRSRLDVLARLVDRFSKRGKADSAEYQEVRRSIAPGLVP